MPLQKKNETPSDLVETSFGIARGREVRDKPENTTSTYTCGKEAKKGSGFLKLIKKRLFYRSKEAFFMENFVRRLI